MGYYTLPDKKDRNEETAFHVLWEPLKNQAKEILAKGCHTSAGRLAQSVRIDDRKPINIIDQNQSINTDWFHLLMKIDSASPLDYIDFYQLYN